LRYLNNLHKIVIFFQSLREKH